MATEGMLGERYEIETRLGSGGMASVYQGRDRLLGRPVAIKVLAERYADNDQFVTRFRREARAAAGLNHPNIVAVYDTGDTDGEHYIVMELVQGETLADLVHREGPLSQERAAHITAAVARALQAAHDQGLVHRDVKPGNVMLTRDGDVKVMDFGIARAASDDSLTQTGLVLGTVSYLSPEQSRGDAVDARSDVYSLGCVLYEMLTGRPPFSGDAPVSVAYKHVHDPPSPPSSINGSIPPELERVVLRALEKNPAKRFQSADAIREAMTAAVVAGEPTAPLDEATAALPSADRAPTMPIRTRAHAAPRSRKPVALVLALLLIAGLTAAGLALFGGEGRLPEASREQRGEPVHRASVGQALRGLQALVAQNADALPADAAEGLLVEAELAVVAYGAEDLESAARHLGVADAVIEAAYEEGSTPQETAAQLHDAVAVLAERMGLELPSTEVPSTEPGKEEDEVLPDEEDDGPGNSEFAPGQSKKGKSKHG